MSSIQSEAVLGKVIDALDLNRAWRVHRRQPAQDFKTLALLKGRIELRPVRVIRIRPVDSTRSADLIEIRVFSEDASEAAELANAIAQSYREFRSRIIPTDIVDRAVPGLRPVRPNKPLNIALGIIGGMVLALAAGAAMAGIAVWIRRRSRRSGAPPGTGAAPPLDLPTGGGSCPKSSPA